VTDLNFFRVDELVEMINRTLVVSADVATPSVLVTHVTCELKIGIRLADVSWTEARLRDDNEHLWVAVWKTALPYAVRQFYDEDKHTECGLNYYYCWQRMTT